MKFGPHVLSISFGDSGFGTKEIGSLRNDHEQMSRGGLTAAKSIFVGCASIRIMNEVAEASEPEPGHTLRAKHGGDIVRWNVEAEEQF
jgi:hypothetical protein